jgi:hypothetical protein
LKNFDATLTNPSRTKTKSLSLSHDQAAKLTNTTPYFNLKIFDDSDESAGDENEKNDGEQHSTNVNRSSTRDDDEREIVPISRSHSLDDISRRSSIYSRPNHNHSARDVLTRRHALDTGGVNHLRNYMRHRKNSIVQRVIGYNYDDHSTAGGLYIRVGIGSKTRREEKDTIDAFHFRFSFLFGHGDSFRFSDFE